MADAPSSPPQDISPRNLSRRAVLHLAVAGGGLLMAASLPSAGEAAATMPKKAVAYQDTPKGKARCDNCRQWVAPAACKIVAGPISPTGWCAIYASKA